jgi:large subunit ribosomal protein L25
MINSSDKILFHVFSRDVSGTASSRKLRNQGKVVGNVFGLGTDSIGIFMDKQAIKKLYASHGDTGLIYLEVDDSKKQVPVLISEYETDPFGNEILHVAFRRVNLTDPIQAEISVYMVGEADIPESVVSLVKDSVEVEALPADLPDKFEIDISTLTEIGQTVSLADLVYDKSKVKLVLDEDEDPSQILLVIVQEIAGEVEEEETPETQVGEEDVEAEAEGETKAEGEPKDNVGGDDKKPAEISQDSDKETSKE